MMRKTFLIISLIMAYATFSQGQAIDSATVQSLKAGIIQMRGELSQFHSEYSDGVIFLGAGAALGIVSFALPVSVSVDRYGIEHRANGANQVLGIMSGILLTVGSIQIIDSHKHIRRASSWTFTEGGIRLNF